MLFSIFTMVIFPPEDLGTVILVVPSYIAEISDIPVSTAVNIIEQKTINLLALALPLFTE